MENNRRWAGKITDLADLSEECSSILPLIEIAGNQRVLIEHHKGVVEDGRERIIVQVKKGSVAVLGDNLELSKMTNHQLIISGYIHSVELEQ